MADEFREWGPGSKVFDHWNSDHDLILRRYAVEDDRIGDLVPSWLVRLRDCFQEAAIGLGGQGWATVFHSCVRWCQRGVRKPPPPWKRAAIIALILDSGSVVAFLDAQDDAP